jgi:glycosyltransferase involved in cell wall biosynthesis
VPISLLALGHSYVLAVNRAVLRALALDHDFEVTVAAPEFFHGDYRLIHLEPEPAGSPLRVVGLPVRWTNHPHLYHFAGTALKVLLHTGNFDVVSVWEEPYIFAGWQAARAVSRHSRARFCLYSCQNLSNRYPPPFSWFERWVIGRADGWQASGELVKNVLISRGYPAERVAALSLAVDTALFRPQSPEERRRTLSELGLESPVIGFVGRLIPQKGIAVLLNALEGLPADMAWSALFLGDGPERERILTWAAERGWSSRVRVQLAKHEEVPRFLGAMDVLAAPSQTTPQWKEQFGRMLIEAFACGVPVIGSDSGEIPHVIGEAGLIVPEAESALWTAALAELLTDPVRRERLAQLGLARAQEFSAVSLSKHYATFYRSLITKPPISRVNVNMALKD